MSHVTCHVSHVMCPVSPSPCQMSHVTFPLSPMLTAKARNPSLANSPTMHSRLIRYLPSQLVLFPPKFQNTILLLQLSLVYRSSQIEQCVQQAAECKQRKKLNSQITIVLSIFTPFKTTKKRECSGKKILEQKKLPQQQQRYACYEHYPCLIPGDARGCFTHTIVIK